MCRRSCCWTARPLWPSDHLSNDLQSTTISNGWLRTLESNFWGGTAIKLTFFLSLMSLRQRPTGHSAKTHEPSMSQKTPSGRKLTSVEQFFLFGMFGWCVEVVFTAVMDSFVTGQAETPIKLAGNSYLWMHPIYGGGILMGTHLLKLMKGTIPLPGRLVMAVIVCFAIEYSSGAALVAFVGTCPWDYSQAAWNVHGLIRLDYAPAWALLGYIVEILADIIDRVRIN